MSKRELKFTVPDRHSAGKIADVFNLGPEEYWRSVVLDTLDRRIEGQDCLLFLRSSPGSSRMLVFKGPQSGRGGVSERPPICTIAPDDLGRETDALRWLRRNYDLNPSDRELLDRLIAEVGNRPIFGQRLVPNRRRRGSRSLQLPGDGSFEARLELDRSGRSNQLEGELPDELADEKIAEVQEAVERESLLHAQVTLTRGAPSKFDDVWSPSTPDPQVPAPRSVALLAPRPRFIDAVWSPQTAPQPALEPRSMALLAPLTRFIDLWAATNPLLQRPQDARFERPDVRDHFTTLVQAFDRFDGEDGQPLVTALDAFDRVRAVQVPPPTELRPAQLEMLRAFKTRFGSLASLDSSLVHLVQPGVELLSDHTLPALLRWMLSPHSTVNVPNMENLADLLTGVLHAASPLRWDPVLTGPAQLTQREMDLLVLCTLGTDILTKGRVGRDLDDVEVAPLTVGGERVGRFGEVRARFVLAAHRWVDEQLDLPESIREVARRWLRQGALPRTPEELEREAAESGVDLDTLAAMHQRLDLSGMVTLVQPFLDGTHLHALLPFEPFRYAVVEQMGAPVSIAQELYLAHLAHGANAFLNRSQTLAGLELDFERMERERQLPKGGAKKLRRLYGAQKQLNLDHGVEIEKAIRQDDPVAGRLVLQHTLFWRGRHLRDALDQIGLLGRLQLLEDDLTNFSERSMAKWWGIAEADCGSKVSARIADQLARTVNRYFYNQFSRGLDIAQEFIERCAPTLKKWGLEFIRFEGENSPFGEWRRRQEGSNGA